MKFSKMIITLIGLLLLITGCSGTNSESKVNSLSKESEYDDLPSEFIEDQTSIKVYTDNEAYSLPVTDIVLKIENTGEANVGFGEPRYLEKLEEGTWYQIPYDSLAFEAIGLDIKPGSIEEQELPLENLDYQLTQGTYRITKTFNIESKEYILAAEFEIKE